MYAASLSVADQANLTRRIGQSLWVSSFDSEVLGVGASRGVATAWARGNKYMVGSEDTLLVVAA